MQKVTGEKRRTNDMGVVNYSPLEEFLIEALRKSRQPMSISELTDIYYDQERPRPWHAEMVVRNALNSLRNKAVANNDTFTIERVPSGSRAAGTFKLVPKKGRR